MKFHEKLYALRKGANMTQTDLAEKMNVSRQAVSRWEMGTAMPDVDNLIAISNLFGVTLDELLKDKENVTEVAIPQKREAGGRYWDYVPRKWWIPGAAALLIRLLHLLIYPLVTVLPNQMMWLEGLIPRLIILFKAGLVLMAACFLWALVKWLKRKEALEHQLSEPAQAEPAAPIPQEKKPSNRIWWIIWAVSFTVILAVLFIDMYLQKDTVIMAISPITVVAQVVNLALTLGIVVLVVRWLCKIGNK